MNQKYIDYLNALIERKDDKINGLNRSHDKQLISQETYYREMTRLNTEIQVIQKLKSAYIKLSE